MPDTRRIFLKKCFSLTSGCVAVASGLLTPVTGKAAWKADLFTQTNLQESLNRLFGVQEFIDSGKISLKLPRIAENGAVVPITVTSSLDNVESVAILVEKNPVPLVASFKLSKATECFVSARMKMAETSDVIVIVKTADKFYSARQTVKVTIGGCGG